MYSLRTVVLVAILAFNFSGVGTFLGVFLVMDAKIKEERATFSEATAKIRKRVHLLKMKVKEIKEAQKVQAEEGYNGITLGMWVKANPQFGNRVAGKVLAFKYRGEAYPLAVLKGGREISVFWLEPMKTQR